LNVVAGVSAFFIDVLPQDYVSAYPKYERSDDVRI